MYPNDIITFLCQIAQINSRIDYQESFKSIKFQSVLMEISGTFLVDLSQSNESHTYEEMRKQYNQILSNYEKSGTDKSHIQIDILGTRLSSVDLNKVMHDLFFIHKIEDDPIKGPFIHKFFEVKHITINAGFTIGYSLDFISTFFIYHNIESIYFDCDNIQALSLLHLCKTLPQIPLVCCESFFTKRFSSYELHQTAFLSPEPINVVPLPDQIKATFSGFENNIEIINCKDIVPNEYPIWFQVFSKLTKIRRLSFTVFLQDNPCSKELQKENTVKSYEELVAGIQKNCNVISCLTFNSQTDFLLPPIKNELFQSLCAVSLNYNHAIISLEISQILAQAQEILEPERRLDYIFLNSQLTKTESSLILNFKFRILTDSELEEVIAFITKSSKYEFPKLFNLEFSPKQAILSQQWIRIISPIAKNTSIRHVEIKGTNVSLFVASLSVTKLVKMKKETISINQMGLQDGQVSLFFDQLNDHILDVIMKNLFETSANNLKELHYKVCQIHSQDITQNRRFDEYPNSIESIFIQAKQVIVDLVTPPSMYLRYIGTRTKRLKKLTIQVISKSSDIHLFVRNVLNDLNKLHWFVSTLDILQKGCISFSSCEEQLKYNLYGKYTVAQMSISHEIDANIKEQIILANIYNSTTTNIPFKKLLQIFDLYCQIRKANFTKTSLQSMPVEILVFYRYIAPYIPINPFQLFTDLFYNS